jgi:hypothetical protein
VGHLHSLEVNGISIRGMDGSDIDSLDVSGHSASYPLAHNNHIYIYMEMINETKQVNLISRFYMITRITSCTTLLNEYND